MPLPRRLRDALIASGLALLAVAAGSPEVVTLKGEAVRLADTLAAFELSADDGPIREQVVLRQADGSLVPLLPDPGSRALFLDERLRGRPVEVQGRRYPGLPYLQVTLFRVLENKIYRIPEYYCDVCTISVRFPQVCPCCQGPMELRYQAADP